MTKLKQCPFCGGEAKVHTFTGIDSKQPSMVWVRCNTNPHKNYGESCMGQNPSTDHYESKQEAIKAWNTRKEDKIMEKKKLILDEKTMHCTKCGLVKNVNDFATPDLCDQCWKEESERKLDGQRSGN